MKALMTATLLAVGLAQPLWAQAAETVDHSAHAGHMQLAQNEEMNQGEVRKVDAAAKKITLRHGPLKSLGMPPMTMVFRVRDAALLEGLKPGDKVLFQAEQEGGAIVVTEIKPAQ